MTTARHTTETKKAHRKTAVPATKKRKAAPAAKKKPKPLTARRAPRPAAAPQIDPAFAPVVAAFARDRDVGLGRMFSSPSVLNVKGKIFAMHVRGKFVAKLPKDRVAALVASGAGDFFDPGHGRLMKEWVALADESEPWIALAREAHAFVKKSAG